MCQPILFEHSGGATPYAGCELALYTQHTDAQSHADSNELLLGRFFTTELLEMSAASERNSSY
jgi:hypothetical protein